MNVGFHITFSPATKSFSVSLAAFSRFRHRARKINAMEHGRRQKHLSSGVAGGEGCSLCYAALDHCPSRKQSGKKGHTATAASAKLAR